MAEVFLRMLTTFGGLPVSWKTLTMRTASWAMASEAWSVEAPMCGVQAAIQAAVAVSANGSSPPAGSASNTSETTRIFLEATASFSAGQSMISPRAVFTRIAPGFIRPRNSALIIFLVSALAARCRLMASAALATSAGVAQKPTPRSFAFSGVRERDQATTFISSASARRTTAVPMDPTPRMPSVRPLRPAALPYSFLRHLPPRRSAVASAMRRSAAMSRPMASSATASVFLPGQLVTWMPNSDALARSIVLTPAPARMIRDRFLPASIVAAMTLVERTISTSASPMAPGRSSALRSGFETTVWPNFSRAEMADLDILSAIRIFIRVLLAYLILKWGILAEAGGGREPPKRPEIKALSSRGPWTRP